MADHLGADEAALDVRVDLAGGQTKIRQSAAYPEYGQLVADGKLTTVVLFGQIGDGDEISEWDSGMRGYRGMASWLQRVGYESVEQAPVGRRFRKEIAGVAYERDLLLAIRERVGDSTFGANAVRDNCFSPEGWRCPYHAAEAF